MTKHRDKTAAEAKFTEFHRFPPRKLGEFADGFAIPRIVYHAGAGRWVTYRSDKTDPETLKKPRAPINYIHEHNAGVGYYLSSPTEHTTKRCDVPERFIEVDALALLGINLGYCFVTDDGEEIEAVSTKPKPELYATPDGKCLLVVQSKKKVLAMAWGGALGVFARGIDG
jgi:hypothetical protein